MKAAVLVTVLGLAGQAAADEPGWIRVRADRKLLLFRADGTGRTEGPTAAPFRGHPSPDGASILNVTDQAIHVADRDGKNSHKVSPDGLVPDDPIEDHRRCDQHEREHDVGRAVGVVPVEEGLEQVRGVGDHHEDDADGEAAGAHV